METHFCWKCKKEMPFLDEKEWKKVSPLLRPSMQELRDYLTQHRCSLDVARKAVKTQVGIKFEQITGMSGIHFETIYHHRRSAWGPVCRHCGLLLRTSKAKLCAQCWTVAEPELVMPPPYKLPIKKSLVAALGLILLILLSGSWLLYAYGLSNITGRPESAKIAVISSENKALIWKELKEQGTIQVKALTPYNFYSLVLDEPDAAGARLAWYIARNYNQDHLQDRRMLYWHISGEALTVWLTRHWSADELLAKALEIRQNKVKPSSP